MPHQRIPVTMGGDELVEDRCLDWELGDPSADDVRGAILRLDQTRFTCVTLSAPSGAQLTVGGGAGRYICFYTEDVTSDATSYWSLVAGSGATSEPASLKIGGQLGDYPAAHVVSSDAAIRAAHAFMAGEGRTPALEWVVDNAQPTATWPGLSGDGARPDWPQPESP